ncbi:MAG: hypothetical protein AAGC78_18165 [Cellvibrio sp.]|uniref:hypothetical protein n=1 Tax=Cellvibrio sp. TaxID=1965322 RepID=UPI0031A91289
MNTYVNNYVPIVGILLVLCGLSACRSEPTSPETELQPKTKNELSAEDAEKHHKRVKPGAAVSLKDSSPLHASVPGAYEYHLSLISPVSAGEMTVVASAGDGIAILSPITQFEFALQDGGEYVIPLTINAAQEGRFYIQLHVTVKTGEQSVSRVIAVILQVGDTPVTKQKASVNSSDAQSDSVIVLPAQETISPR